MQFSFLKDISCAASYTVKLGLQIIASDGFKVRTVPGALRAALLGDEIGLYCFFLRSFSIFFRIASSFLEVRVRESDPLVLDNEDCVLLGVRDMFVYASLKIKI